MGVVSGRTADCVTYAEAVQYLYALGNEIPTAKFGLERITKLLAGLGNPQAGGRFIHVAGTNGKGSTSAMIEAGLRAAGQRTGLYTSPHLSEATERIQVDGRPVTGEQFAASFRTVHETALRMMAAGELDLHPTYFESVTAMAFVLFRDAAVDWVVLEVGMGGRHDATNVVTPELCVITPVDLDHQFFLGNTLAKIAAEKAGILKPGVPAVISPQHPEAAQVIREAARGPLIWVEEHAVESLEIDAEGSRFVLDGAMVVCPLAGVHQVDNARTAALALQAVGFGAEGISETGWPGRLERVRQNPDVILDGAHNPAGVRALVAHIRRFYAGRPVWLVWGVMRDKSVEEMTADLFPLADRIILTAAANSRALPVDKIAAPADAWRTGSVAEALELIRDAPANAAVFVTGSLFVVGEARARLVQ